MAMAMRGRVDEMRIGWRKNGRDLSLGIGIAEAFASISAIVLKGRLDCGVVDTASNLAARLCGEAKVDKS